MALVRNNPDLKYENWRMKIGYMPEFSGAEWSYQETPTRDKSGGTEVVPDGVTRNWFVKYEPIANTETVYKDGMLMKRGLDYVIDYEAKKITFTDDTTDRKGQIPQPKSVMAVTYKYQLRNV